MPCYLLSSSKKKTVPLYVAGKKEIGLPIHIWHVFFDRAYGLAFDEAERLVAEGFIEPTIQTFQATRAAQQPKKQFTNTTTTHYAYPLGISTEKPQLLPEYIEDKNGHILPYAKFDGGSLQISVEAQELCLKRLAHEKS